MSFSSILFHVIACHFLIYVITYIFSSINFSSLFCFTLFFSTSFPLQLHVFFSISDLFLCLKYFLIMFSEGNLHFGCSTSMGLNSQQRPFHNGSLIHYRTQSLFIATHLQANYIHFFSHCGKYIIIIIGSLKELEAELKWINNISKIEMSKHISDELVFWLYLLG